MLYEISHVVDTQPWVYYELRYSDPRAGTPYGIVKIPLGDFPDDGKPVVQEVVRELRAKTSLGLQEAYAIWKARQLEFES
jgi:hypothetical protein